MPLIARLAARGAFFFAVAFAVAAPRECAARGRPMFTQGEQPGAKEMAVARAPSPPTASHIALLPRDSVVVRLPAPTGRRIRVKDGDDLEDALGKAHGGDVLLLDPGATFKGPIRLPARAFADSGWITIRTGAADSDLPSDSERVTARHAALLPKLISPSAASPAIVAGRQAHHYRLMGLEVTAAPEIKMVFALVILGEPGQDQSTGTASQIILDRMYIHGRDDLGLQRCVLLASARTAVVNSTLSMCHIAGFDSQAIIGWNGPGPYRIENNYLEGAGENLMFGGAHPATPNLVPCDITIRRNHFRKPASWRHASWTIKNLIEIKFGRRVLIEGNVFDGSWTQAQTGFAWVFKVDAQAVWVTTEDVTVRFNRARNMGAGIQINAVEGPFKAVAPHVRRLTIQDNVLDEVNVPPYNGAGRLMLILSGVIDLVVDHNTMTTRGPLAGLMIIDGTPGEPAVTGFVFRRNIVTRGDFGVFGSGLGEGMRPLEQNAPGADFSDNVLIGHAGVQYPQGTMIVSRMDEVYFVDPGHGDYRLSPASPYRRLNPPRGYAGADVDAMNALIRGVVLPEEQAGGARP